MKRDLSPVSTRCTKGYNSHHGRGNPIVNISRRLLRTLLLCGLITLPGLSLAGEVRWADQVLAAKSAISLEEATEIVRRAYGGRVLSASPTSKNGKKGYQVRVLLDGGRVKTVFVDSSGSVRG
jgi:hypothetical protein